jgi:hypothetical protein
MLKPRKLLQVCDKKGPELVLDPGRLEWDSLVSSSYHNIWRRRGIRKRARALMGWQLLFAVLRTPLTYFGPAICTLVLAS